MSKYRLNVNNAICLFDGFGYWQNPSNKLKHISVGKLKYISAGQSLQFIKLFYREVLLRSLSLNAFFHLDAHSWFAYYLNIRNLWKKRQKSINLFKYKRVTKFKPVDKLCLNLSVKKKSKNVVIRLWSLQRRMRSHAAKKKDRRLFKKFCKHFNIYRWDGTVDYRRFDRYYRWKYRQFHRFNGNVKLFHKYNFSHYLYRKAFWETNTTYVRPLKFRLRRFWRFIIKPFFFWMIYYFNQFFLIYYKALFVIWIRYLFRKTNVANFIKLYGYSDYFVNKKDVKSFNWFLPFEANITFLATSARKQFYYFNALFGIFRAARKRSFKINHDFFFHFKRYKCKRRLFRRRYKFIYIYHQAFKHHLFKTFSISGWRRVLKRLEFRKFIRNANIN
jgi:hypothetical protein